MGLLDGMLGNALDGLLRSQGAQAQNPLVQMALQVLQQNGGITGVVEKLRSAGYGAQADSWVGTGANQPIPPAALQQALGSGTIGDIASRLGIGGGDAANGLASVLPGVIDKLTPQGSVPGNHADLVSKALAMLQQARSA